MVFFLIAPLTSDVPSVDGSSGHLCLWEGPCGGTECDSIDSDMQNGDYISNPHSVKIPVAFVSTANLC